jgi:[acyl-carrier-protein] S-malonyltransferase
VTATRSPLPPGETALLFPTGGAHFPGMGVDLEDDPATRALLDEAEAALLSVGVPAGSLRALMGGEGQARREATERGWEWCGDFPLSVAAQTALGATLGLALEARFGRPACVLGESMGECAAYAVAGALSVGGAVVLAHRWAAALARASDELGLRMAVVDRLGGEDLAEVARPLDGRVVVSEAPTLNVLSVPRRHLERLEAVVAERGGRVLVSTNPCVAHDPRLREAGSLWDEHLAFLEALPLAAARLPLLSALEPGRPLAAVAELRENLRATSFREVRWAATVATLPGRGVRTLLQIGTPSRSYALERLRDEEPGLAGLRIKTLRTRAGLERLATRTRVV